MAPRVIGETERGSFKPRRRLQRSLSAMAGDSVVESIYGALEVDALPVKEDMMGMGADYLRLKGHEGGQGNEGVGPVVFGEMVSGSFPRLDGVGHLTPDMRDDLLTSLQDPSPLRSLEAGGVLHWHKEAANMVALKTESDGNCLLHALSLGCLGIHDRQLILRRSLANFFTQGGENGLVRRIRRRWERELTKACELDQATLELEWHEVERTSGLEYVENGFKSSYHYLEATHIFVMAHILRRPIIVLSCDWRDSQGRKLAAAEEIAGVYLPLEWPKELCTRTPLVLAFDAFHFSALVPLHDTTSHGPALLPLADRDHKLLPVPFFHHNSSSTTTPQEMLKAALLKHWMDCDYLSDGVLAVKLDDPREPCPLVSTMWERVVQAYERGEPPAVLSPSGSEEGEQDDEEAPFTSRSYWEGMTEAQKVERLKAIQQEEFDWELALQMAYAQKQNTGKGLTFKSLFGGRLWGGGMFRLRKVGWASSEGMQQ